MPSPDVPLYVRLPADQAERLAEAASLTGLSKRQLVETAIRSHLEIDGGQMTVGRATLREELPEVLTLEQVAKLLQTDDESLHALAESGGLPGRRIGDQWRFSRVAVMAWLAGLGPTA